MPERKHKSREIRSTPIAWVNRLDLINCRPDLREQIESLDEAGIDDLAEKVGDALQETYWLAMDVILTDFLERKDGVASATSISPQATPPEMR